MISAYKVQPRQEIKGCQPCARPHSAGSVPPAPPLTSPQAPQNARLMTALHSRARLRPARSQMSTGHLRKPLTTSIPHRHQTCRAELPGIACPVGCNTKAVSVEPVLHSSTGFAKASPSPPFSPVSTDAIIPRTWKTCGLLRRRLLRSATLAHSYSAALHSRSLRAPLRSLCSESHKTPGRPSDPSGVRSAHLSPRNLQDCPDIPVRIVSTMSISKTAKSGQSAIPCRHPILPARSAPAARQSAST